MERLFKIIMAAVMMLGLVGCKSVNSLIQNGDYVGAVTKINEDLDKYSNEAEVVLDYFKNQGINNDELSSVINVLSDGEDNDFIDELKNLYASTEFEKALLAIEDEKDELNPDTWVSGFDYVNGSDYFLKYRSSVLDIRDDIVKYDNLDEIKDDFITVFGYTPATLDEANEIVNKMIEELFFGLKDYDNLDAYLIYLDGICTNLMHFTDYVRFSMTDTSGFMVIEKPYEFFEEKKLTPDSFAHIMGIFIDSGAVIERNDEKIEITWTKGEYSRGYYYCVNNEQIKKTQNIMENLQVSANNAYITDAGLDVEWTIKGFEDVKIKHLMIETFIVNDNEKFVNSSYKVFDNFNQNEINETITYKGTKSSDFGDSGNFYYNWFMTMVFEE